MRRDVDLVYRARYIPWGMSPDRSLDMAVIDGQPNRYIRCDACGKTWDHQVLKHESGETDLICSACGHRSRDDPEIVTS